jgi:hypothetical protein
VEINKTNVYRVLISVVLLSLFMLISPQRASAYGGFFCNVQDPINQAAERILFAVQDDETEMHVQVQY